MSAPKSVAPAATQLIEEAVHLLRAAPAGAWAIYLAGAVPWVLGLGYFWAATSWFAPRPEAVFWRAVGLAGLFIWLKVAQSEFCRCLRAVRFGEEPAPFSWQVLTRTAGRQARLQGWALPLVSIAAMLALPFAASWMFFENVTALSATTDTGNASLARRAWKEALRWPKQAHVALLLFCGLWLCVWINIATCFYALPWLARSLLGMENLFGLSGWSALNSTLLALVTILTWLAVDPLVKAYHVLRTFYGEALHTGEDLRLELLRPTASGGLAKTMRLVLVAILLNLLTGTDVSRGGLQAQEVAAPSPAQVDNALDEALRGRDFRWSLQPLPTQEEPNVQDGLIKRLVRQGVDLLKQMVLDASSVIKKIGNWIDGLFKNQKNNTKPDEPKPSSWDMQEIMRVALYLLLGLFLLVLVWLLWTSWNKKPTPRHVLSPLSAKPLAPDLNDERLEASRLPVQDWLELARTQMLRGEWRLALRALYLCSLAKLGEQKLIHLARAKTNLDYERELTRRAAGRSDLVAEFRKRRLSFEAVWYGRAFAEESGVRAWLTELERAENTHR